MQSESRNQLISTLALIRVNYAYAGEYRLGKSFSALSGITAEEKDVGRKLLLASRKDIKRVIFTGGETTLWPPLTRMIKLAHKIGLEAHIQSDACRISSFDAAEALKRCGLSGIETTIAGPDATAHEMIFEPGSYIRTLNGLENCKKAGLAISIVVPLHSGNYKHIAETAESLRRLEPQSITFRLPNPADFSDDALIVPMQAAATELRRAFSLMQQNGIGKNCALSYGGLPVCLLPDFGEYNSDLDAAECMEYSEITDSAFAAFAFSERLHVEECAGCRHTGECPGPYAAAIDRHMVKARPRPVSNSIVFVAEKTLDNFDVEKCPILAGRLQIGDAEHCILLDKGGGKAELYCTSSADFDPTNMQRIIHKLGQVYLDLSGEIYHYDFEKELKKLTPHPVCKVCPERPNCPALHMPIEENLFRKAENLFLVELEKIRGRVLDVGCGAVRSKGVIGRLLDEKLIEYYAVEPTPPDALREFLHQHCIDSNLFAAQVEHYEVPPESFDWILLLCSYNHLYDIDRAFQAMHSWLKPGGHMLLLENIAYGVLRERSIWEKINQTEGATCFEHYHNHTSEEVLQHLLAAGFTLISEIPVTGDTANQWQVIVRKS